ncbi:MULTISPECIES: hypothetical protein [Streptomycetaceae]|uniref:hypothetical protein n=1 Tax=Streptomycetaceae TaxID=2062 RepID=UPI00093F2F44|nr:hypothetical protein [Streptomyces sp. CB02056]OKI06817.1 hypothetical protein AMK13_15425 [Streptomyces sp. CB02056]
MNAVPSRVVFSRLAAAAGAVALAGGLLLVPASAPARAQGVVDVQCTGTFTDEFTPALTNQPQNVTIATQNSYATCVTGLPGSSSVTNSEPGETCLNVLHTLTPFDETITWSDQTTSTVHWASVEDTGGAATFTGTVTAGRYLGDAAVKATEAADITGTNPELCPVGGGTITGASGPADLTLTSV